MNYPGLEHQWLIQTNQIEKDEQFFSKYAEIAVLIMDFLEIRELYVRSSTVPMRLEWI
jgi:hypothetical protein